MYVGFELLFTHKKSPNFKECLLQFFPSEMAELFYFADEGVAVGCGWQALVAYINIGCYYFIGVPLGVLLGFKFDYGIKVLYIFNLVARFNAALIRSFCPPRWQNHCSC